MRLEDKIQALKKEMAHLRKLEVQMLEAPGEQASLTDPDARSMATSGRGTGMVGYNVQTLVNRKHHFIVAHEVTNVGRDRTQLFNMRSVSVLVVVGVIAFSLAAIGCATLAPVEPTDGARELTGYRVVRSGGLLGKPIEVVLQARGGWLIVEGTSRRVGDSDEFAKKLAIWNKKGRPDEPVGADIYVYEVYTDAAQPDVVLTDTLSNAGADMAMLLETLHAAFSAAQEELDR